MDFIQVRREVGPYDHGFPTLQLQKVNVQLVPLILEGILCGHERMILCSAYT